MRIAVVQLTSTDDVSENLSNIECILSSLKNQSVQAVCLPECFALMQRSVDQLRTARERPGRGPIQAYLAHASKHYGLWIFAGGMPFKASCPDKATNTQVVYNDQGKQVARYDKIHLFDVILSDDERYLESSYTEPGQAVVTVDTPWAKIGLSICYDLRFPELYRKLTQMGADVLLVPSAFSPTTGRDHWLSLLRARAIENTCFVIAAAQTGRHPSGRKTWGHSVVIDPWGDIICDLGEESGALVVDLDLDRLADIRRKMPSLTHRSSHIS